MGAQDQGGSVRCLGYILTAAERPCFRPAESFVAGGMEGDDGRPQVMAVPCCRRHVDVVGRTLAYSPLGESTSWPIDLLDQFRERMAAEFGEFYWEPVERTA